MKTLIALIFAVSMLAQVQTPLTVLPGAGSSTGEIRLRERKNQAGGNYTGFKAPQALAADEIYEMPGSDGTIGQALVTNGGKVLSWASVAGNTIPTCNSTTVNDTYTCTVPGFTSYSAGYCIILNADTANTTTATVNITAVGAQSILRYGGSALSTNDILANEPVMICYNGTAFTLPPSASPGSGAFLDGGNTFGADATLGTNDSFALNFETDGFIRWTINPSGMLIPGAISQFDIGDSVNRVRTLYATAGEFFSSGGTGASDYVSMRKANFLDTSGGSGAGWDLQANVTVSSSSLFLRDNAGDPVWYAYRQESAVAVNRIDSYASILPSKRDTGDGHTVRILNSLLLAALAVHGKRFTVQTSIRSIFGLPARPPSRAE